MKYVTHPRVYMWFKNNKEYISQLEFSWREHYQPLRSSLCVPSPSPPVPPGIINILSFIPIILLFLKYFYHIKVGCSAFLRFKWNLNLFLRFNERHYNMPSFCKLLFSVFVLIHLCSCLYCDSFFFLAEVF